MNSSMRDLGLFWGLASDLKLLQQSQSIVNLCQSFLQV